MYCPAITARSADVVLLNKVITTADITTPGVIWKCLWHCIWKNSMFTKQAVLWIVTLIHTIIIHTLSWWWWSILKRQLPPGMLIWAVDSIIDLWLSALLKNNYNLYFNTQIILRYFFTAIVNKVVWEETTAVTVLGKLLDNPFYTAFACSVCISSIPWIYLPNYMHSRAGKSEYVCTMKLQSTVISHVYTYTVAVT